MNLLPEVSQKTSLERKYIRHILRADPGIGEKSIAIANSLAESGFSASAASMILQAVYSPSVALERGRGTRIKWFVQAINDRYSSRLDRIKTDYKAFRSFLSDMEEVTEMRDMLTGEGYTLSFHAAFVLWELGEDANSISLMITNHLEYLMDFKGSQIKRVVEAALAVKAGQFSEVESALQFMCRDSMQRNEDDE